MKIRLIQALSFALLFGVMAVAAQTTPQTHDEFVQAGKEAFAKKDYTAAAMWYGKAVGVRPENHTIRSARAAALYLSGKMGEAAKEITVILDALPGDLFYLYVRASYYNGAGDHKKAFQDAEAILKVEPNNAGAYQARGTSYLGRKKYTEALADLNKAISLNPRDPASYTVRAAIHEIQGNAGMAQADKLKAQQLSGN